MLGRLLIEDCIAKEHLEVGFYGKRAFSMMHPKSEGFPPSFIVHMG